MHFLNKFSIQFKIIFLSFFIIFTLGIGNLYQTNKLQKSYELQLETNLQNSATNLASAISAQFFERYGDVQAFAINSSVQTMNGKLMQEYLNSYVTLYGIYDLILVVDSQGKFVAANDKDYSGLEVKKSALAEYDFSKEPWFKAAINGQFTEDKEKGFSGTYFEDFQVDPLMNLAVNEKRYTSSFTATIKNSEGKVIGVITNRAGSRWVESEFVKAYDTLKLNGLAKVGIKLFNNQNQLIINHEPSKFEYQNELVHNEEILFKKQLDQLNPEFINLFEKNQSGHTDYNNQIENINYVAGYSWVNDSKFMKSTGWKIMIDDDENEALAVIYEAKFNFYLFLSIVSIFMIGASYFFARTLSQSVNQVVTELHKNSTSVLEIANLVNNSSNQISEGANNQSSALHETVTAMDEISAMVGKSAQSAQNSMHSSATSRHAAEEGRKIVSNMLDAINDIKNSNEELASKFEESNKKIEDIIVIIDNISSKTKVINDIVFQTKLLSFNASVEAARAGEHGKGFAVVAEEVGNLATMSGTAANEITSLVNDSINRVQKIISDTQGSINSLVSKANKNIDLGQSTAQECDHALENILESVSKVDELVSEISTATQEQSTGIKEVTQAMNQIDQVNRENTHVAKESLMTSESLKSNSIRLEEIVEHLSNVINGFSANTNNQNSNVISLDLKHREDKFKKVA